jgi:hypothetical protein
MAVPDGDAVRDNEARTIGSFDGKLNPDCPTRVHAGAEDNKKKSHFEGIENRGVFGPTNPNPI